MDSDRYTGNISSLVFKQCIAIALYRQVLLLYDSYESAMLTNYALIIIFSGIFDFIQNNMLSFISKSIIRNNDVMDTLLFR